ncbi:Alpha/Beta hydrolase protein [Chytriomyces sp. MP71]|nr:Alpha/Beta hydrolase protein [Chytriomyces sp. MP71]
MEILRPLASIVATRRAKHTLAVCVVGIFLLDQRYSRRRSVLRYFARLLLVEIPSAVLFRPRSAPTSFGVLAVASARLGAWLTCGQISDVRPIVELASSAEAEAAQRDGLVIEKVEQEDGIQGRWLTLEGEHLSLASLHRPLVLLWLHGGGYIINSSLNAVTHHHRLLKEVKEAGRTLVIFNLEYSLAPEAKFPKQIVETANAFSWLNKRLPANATLVVGGDSAGGHLAISLLSHIEKTPALKTLKHQPVASILVSPWVNPFLTKLPEVYFDIINLELGRIATNAAFDGVDSPGVNLLALNRIHMAKKGTLVIYGGIEMIRETIEAFIEKLEVQGVKGLTVWKAEDETHCFNIYALRREASKVAIQKTAAFLQAL